jgi:glycosyltransferase involved in cell wall biosynthesis
MQSPNSTSPLISVMMPTYNRLDYLQQAVGSILRQTLQDFELLIYNDASKDGTSAWLSKLAREDSRVRVIEAAENPGGCFRGRQVLMEQARGKYLALMDDDDISLPKRFEHQARFLETHIDVAVLGCQTIKFKGQPPLKKKILSHHRLKRHAELISSLLFTLPFTHSTTMFRRSLIIGHNYPSVRTREDAMFFWNLARAGKKFACIPEVLLLYRKHAQNSCNVKSTDPDWETHVRIMWRDLGLPESIINRYAGMTIASYSSSNLLTCPMNQRKVILKKSLLQMFSLYKILLKANKKSKLLDSASMERILIERWEQHCRVYAKWIPTLALYIRLLPRSSWYGKPWALTKTLLPIARITIRNLFAGFTK